MLKKGSMRNVKTILGWVTLALGVGLVLFPVMTAVLFVKFRVLIGIGLGFLGYLNTRAGSQL